MWLFYFLDFLVEDVEGAQSSNMKLDPAKFEAFLSKRTCPKEESRNALYQLMEHFLHLFQQKDKKKVSVCCRLNFNFFSY